MRLGRHTLGWRGLRQVAGLQPEARACPRYPPMSHTHTHTQSDVPTLSPAPFCPSLPRSVKIVDKRAKGGRLYLKKGTVVDVKTPTGAPHVLCGGWRVAGWPVVGWGGAGRAAGAAGLGQPGQ